MRRISILALSAFALLIGPRASHAAYQMPLQLSTQSGITAAGTTQGTATVLSAQVSIVSIAPVGSGVILPSLPPGAVDFVCDDGVNSIAVYPPSGSNIVPLSSNAGFSVAAGACAMFVGVASTSLHMLAAFPSGGGSTSVTLMTDAQGNLLTDAQGNLLISQ